MARAPIGARVGAILKLKEGVCEFFGYGTYVGDEVPPEDAGGFNLGIETPKIQLDNGDVVFGCECWWGPEKQIAERIKSCQIVEVRIADLRKRAAPAQAEGE